METSKAESIGFIGKKKHKCFIFGARHPDLKKAQEKKSRGADEELLSRGGGAVAVHAVSQRFCCVRFASALRRVKEFPSHTSG